MATPRTPARVGLTTEQQVARLVKGAFDEPDIRQHRVVTDDYTIADVDDIILVDTAAGDVTITLPLAIRAKGRTFVVKKIAAPSTLMVAAQAPELIDGTISVSWTPQWDSDTFFSTGTEWVTL